MTELVLAIFATYGISHIVTLEDGPFDIFALFRDKIETYKQENWIQRGFACPMCVSVWVALLICILSGLGWLEWLAIIGSIRIIHIALYK